MKASLFYLECFDVSGICRPHIEALHEGFKHPLKKKKILRFYLFKSDYSVYLAFFFSNLGDSLKAFYLSIYLRFYISVWHFTFTVYLHTS